jgi:PIN domain nuclease of toxin-antitoxin system
MNRAAHGLLSVVSVWEALAKHLCQALQHNLQVMASDTLFAKYSVTVFRPA